MILVRDVFQLKFGKAREAVAAWKDMRRYGNMGSMRILTDLVGPYYTLVLESTFNSLPEWEQQGRKIMGDPEWRKQYENILPLVESGHREVFNIVE